MTLIIQSPYKLTHFLAEGNNDGSDQEVPAWVQQVVQGSEREEARLRSIGEDRLADKEARLREEFLKKHRGAEMQALISQANSMQQTSNSSAANSTVHTGFLAKLTQCRDSAARSLNMIEERASQLISYDDIETHAARNSALGLIATLGLGIVAFRYRALP